MNTNPHTPGQSASQFCDAEHLWFWFVASRKIRNGFYRQTELGNRPCELVDVETVITKLFMAGKLSSEQLTIMKEWGERRRAPSQHVYAQNRAAYMWSTAMAEITVVARTRGWIE